MGRLKKDINPAGKREWEKERLAKLLEKKLNHEVWVQIIPCG